MKVYAIKVVTEADVECELDDVKFRTMLESLLDAPGVVYSTREKAEKARDALLTEALEDWNIPEGKLESAMTPPNTIRHYYVHGGKMNVVAWSQLNEIEVK